MSPTTARIWTARSGVKRTNYGATAPSTPLYYWLLTKTSQLKIQILLIGFYTFLKCMF